MKRAIEPFYPIVDGAAWVERLIPCGARFIQLRIKECPQAHVRAEVRAALAACRRHGVQLVVNDYWQIAIEEGGDFVHLGQGDLEGADLRSLRSAGVKLGVSTHDHAELDRALAVEPDYVALGPIYPTVLKQMPWAPQGVERIAEWKRRVRRVRDMRDVPLVAIGGLAPERARLVLAAGADAAAVVTDIVRNPRPELRAREWVAATTPEVLGEPRESGGPRET
jgi:thiamine-phosphate pyrophosphorylase